MTIHIEALKFNAIIGLLDFEREKTQPVRIELSASYEYEPNQFINYADMAFLIEEHIKKQRYELLEDALLGTQKLLCQTYPQINSLFLKISKPEILPNCTVALSKKWVF